MRCARAAIINAILFGLGMLVFPVMFSPAAIWKFLMLFVAAILGALLTYLHQRCISTQLSLRGYTLLGAAMGFTTVLVYFGSGTILFAVLTNRHIVLNRRELEQAVLGIVTFSVASGAGGLVMGLLALLTKLRASRKIFIDSGP